MSEMNVVGGKGAFRQEFDSFVKQYKSEHADWKATFEGRKWSEKAGEATFKDLKNIASEKHQDLATIILTLINKPSEEADKKELLLDLSQAVSVMPVEKLKELAEQFRKENATDILINLVQGAAFLIAGTTQKNKRSDEDIQRISELLKNSGVKMDEKPEGLSTVKALILTSAEPKKRVSFKEDAIAEVRQFSPHEEESEETEALETAVQEEASREQAPLPEPASLEAETAASQLTPEKAGEIIGKNFDEIVLGIISAIAKEDESDQAVAGANPELFNKINELKDVVQTAVKENTLSLEEATKELLHTINEDCFNTLKSTEPPVLALSDEDYAKVHNFLNNIARQYGIELPKLG